MAPASRYVLNPIGDVLAPGIVGGAEATRGVRLRRYVGFIDNSKPNVTHVVQTLTRELRTAGETEIVSTTKPRSAGPSHDIDFLVDHCRIVVNAVAD